MNPLYQQIIDTPSPAFRGNVRRLYRKEWSKLVKRLLKDLGLGFVSVTAPNYSMAQSIDIRFHQVETPAESTEHQRLHDEIDRAEIATGGLHVGFNRTCKHCHQRWAAHQALERIILAAYPDLDNRSDSQSDYFDYCLSIE